MQKCLNGKNNINKHSASQGDQNSGFRGVCHFVGVLKDGNIGQIDTEYCLSG